MPSIPAALREICRVLRPEGRVVFLEPGAYHASTGKSQAMMRDFGVLEQDIVVADFMQQCTEAGFEHVAVASLAYMMPGMRFLRHEWLDWRRRTRMKRPLRAATKMWRDVLEFFGLGKGDALFEEAWYVHVSRILGELMEIHPIILACRTEPVGRSHRVDYRGAIEVRAAPKHVAAGEPVRLRVKVHNTGSMTWRASAADPTPTRVGLQLLTEDGRLLNRDYARASLPRDVSPGDRCDLPIECFAPGVGSYLMKIDLVIENVTWFELKGSAPVTLPLHVS